jgi:Uncharacterised nucleotidyltransferase
MHPEPLMALLLAPGLAAQWSGCEWNQTLLMARRNQMLGALAAHLKRAGHWASVPPEVQRHMNLDLLTAQRRAESALWELTVIRRAVPEAIPLVLLKGCAYLAANDANAEGRLFSDLDLLVPKSKLGDAETALIGAGYRPGRVDAYDNRYYRNWMHEIPPMDHLRRHTVLDLHHAINPPVSRAHVLPGHLISAAVQLPASAGFSVLQPVDRLIHCALHAIQEGESKKLLRDLWDLKLLVEQHAPNGLGMVLQRAELLGVRSMVDSACHALRILFSTHALAAGPAPSLLTRVLVRAARNRLSHPSLAGTMCEWLLLAHSHWVKMPLRLLVPHLARKAWLAIWPTKSASSA